jgi:hypothetical protein
MTVVAWNAFVEGVCDENKIIPLFKNAPVDMTTLIVFVKKRCEVCYEMMWIKYPLNVCQNCIP